LKALSTNLPNLIQGQQTPLSILPRLAKLKPSFLVHCLQIIKQEHFGYSKLSHIAQAYYTMFITIFCIIITHIITSIGAR